MPQDAFHIRRSAAELDALLKGGKINRVSQADKDEVTFIIYTGKTTVKLVLSTNASNARVCLSLTEKEPAPVAPNFCMLLRKHLIGGKIVAITQAPADRVLDFEIEVYDALGVMRKKHAEHWRRHGVFKIFICYLNTAV